MKQLEGSPWSALYNGITFDKRGQLIVCNGITHALSIFQLTPDYKVESMKTFSLKSSCDNVRYDEERDEVWIGSNLLGYEFLAMKKHVNWETFKLEDSFTAWGSSSKAKFNENGDLEKEEMLVVSNDMVRFGTGSLRIGDYFF